MQVAAGRHSLSSVLLPHLDVDGRVFNDLHYAPQPEGGTVPALLPEKNDIRQFAFCLLKAANIGASGAVLFCCSE